jgi:hypothetical protein
VLQKQLGISLVSWTRSSTEVGISPSFGEESRLLASSLSQLVAELK